VLEVVAGNGLAIRLQAPHRPRWLVHRITREQFGSGRDPVESPEPFPGHAGGSSYERVVSEYSPRFSLSE
jgi:hypothetical protein